MARSAKKRGERPKSKPRLNQVVAERELWLATKRRKRQKVYVRFGKPLPLPDHSDFRCVYQIEGLYDDRVITRHAYGIDSVQALQLAMNVAMVELVCSTAYDEGRLTFLGMYDLGLPITEPIRDLIKKDPKAERIAKQVAAEFDAARRRPKRRRAAKPGRSAR